MAKGNRFSYIKIDHLTARPHTVQRGGKFTSKTVFKFGTKSIRKCVMVARNLIVGSINYVSLLSFMLFFFEEKAYWQLKKVSY